MQVIAVCSAILSPHESEHFITNLQVTSAALGADVI